MAGNSCKIGVNLNEQCHKMSYTRKQGLIAINSLKKDDKLLMERRTGVHFEDSDQLCYHHEVMYLSGYQKKSAKYCADPWFLHKKKITSEFTCYRTIPSFQKANKPENACIFDDFTP